MKNKIKILFLFISVIFISLPAIVSAEKVYYYEILLENNVIEEIGGYKKIDECNVFRVKQKKIFSQDTTEKRSVGDCKEKEISEAPKEVVDVTAKENQPIGKYKSTYTLLAPIGDFKEFKTDDIGKYFNILVKLAIGLCGALAVIMIIINGVMYMGEGSIFKKAQAKDGITDAIIGLLIALGSWAILNTINPDLLGGGGLSIRAAKLEIVSGPDAGDGTVDPNFKTGNETYSSDIPVSSGVNEAVSKLKNGSTIKSFTATTSSKTMIIELSDGTTTQPIKIEIGAKGFSEIGAGIPDDNKTPKGDWKILEIRKSADGKPVFSSDGSNMGATFWLLSPTKNGERGIGMHGNQKGTLTSTKGCLRLTNSDLLALLPYVKAGIPVKIK